MTLRSIKDILIRHNIRFKFKILTILISKKLMTIWKERLNSFQLAIFKVTRLRKLKLQIKYRLMPKFRSYVGRTLIFRQLKLKMKCQKRETSEFLSTRILERSVKWKFSNVTFKIARNTFESGITFLTICEFILERDHFVAKSLLAPNLSPRRQIWRNIWQCMQEKSSSLAKNAARFSIKSHFFRYTILSALSLILFTLKFRKLTPKLLYL